VAISAVLRFVCVTELGASLVVCFALSSLAERITYERWVCRVALIRLSWLRLVLCLRAACCAMPWFASFVRSAIRLCAAIRVSLTLRWAVGGTAWLLSAIVADRVFVNVC
jgi:hypothetical protein